MTRQSGRLRRMECPRCFRPDTPISGGKLRAHREWPAVGPARTTPQCDGSHLDYLVAQDELAEQASEARSAYIDRGYE